MIRCRKAARRDNEKRNVRILSLVLAAFLVIVALRLYGDLEFTDYMCRTDLLLNDSASDPSSIGSTTVTKLHVNGSETSTALTPSTSHAHWHPQDRGERFPSVDERVRLYMSTWYLPPCSKPDLSFHRNNSDSTPTIFIQEKARSQPLSISCEPRRDAVFSIHSKTLAKCVGVRSLPLLSYCNDLFDDFWDFSFDSNPPVLVLAGDIRSEKAMPKADIHSTPVLAKHRKAASIEAVHNATHTKNPSDCTDQRNHLYFDHSNKNDYDVPIPFPPIIWKLNTKRHFGKHLDIVRHTKILWQDKIPKAIWRGDPTGYGRNRVMQNGIHFPEATCNAMPRCLFVKKHVGSHVLDAGFTSIKGHEMEGWMEENGLKKKNPISERATVFQNSCKGLYTFQYCCKP